MGALSKLRVSRDYDLASGSDSILVSYALALVSWPSGDVAPVPLARLLGQQGQHKVIEFLRTSVRLCEAAQVALCTAGIPRAYGDPKQRGRRAYAQFVGQHKDCKLIVIVRSCLGMVDVFFCHKE